VFICEIFSQCNSGERCGPWASCYLHDLNNFWKWSSRRHCVNRRQNRRSQALNENPVSLQMFIWYMLHCLAIRYISNLSLVLIHYNIWLVDFKKYYNELLLLCSFITPPLGVAFSDRYRSKFSVWLSLNYFDWIYCR
jgi:hypothetical protein